LYINGLRKGEGYFQNVWVLWNQASIGVTDYFSIGAGLVPVFLFGSSMTPVWIVPKFSIPVVKDQFNLGVGAIAGRMMGEGGNFGILYGTGTLGNRNKNISFGMGYGFVDGELAKKPMMNLSFMYRTGVKGYFVSENYYFHGSIRDLVLLSFGGRVITKTVGLDFGLIIPIQNNLNTAIAIPWLGITVPFGRKVTQYHSSL
jgi:hypothetical protein